MDTETLIPAPQLNGLDLEELNHTLDQLREQPELARFEFRAENVWIQGTENRSLIHGFYGAGSEDASRPRPFIYTSDAPWLMQGKNYGPTPLECLLHAAASCLTTTLVLHAGARGIKLEKLAVGARGGIDLQGALNVDPEVPPGFAWLVLEVDVQAACSDAELDALLELAHERSPVINTLRFPVQMERVRAA